MRVERWNVDTKGWAYDHHKYAIPDQKKAQKRRCQMSLVHSRFDGPYFFGFEFRPVQKFWWGQIYNEFLMDTASSLKNEKYTGGQQNKALKM